MGCPHFPELHTAHGGLGAYGYWSPPEGVRREQEFQNQSRHPLGKVVSGSNNELMISPKRTEVINELPFS